MIFEVVWLVDKSHAKVPDILARTGVKLLGRDAVTCRG